MGRTGPSSFPKGKAANAAGVILAAAVALGPASAPARAACPHANTLGRGVISGVNERGVVRIAMSQGNPISLRLSGLWPFPSPSGLARLVAALKATEGMEVTVFASSMDKDRDGALAGELAVADFGETLGDGLLAAGAALAAPSSSGTCKAARLAAEAMARQGRLGGWNGSIWPLAPDAQELLARRADFAIVAGRVFSVNNLEQRAYINFGRDHSRTLSLRIPSAIREALGGPDRLKALEGQLVEVRGYVENLNGPLMRLDMAGALRQLSDDEMKEIRSFSPLSPLTGQGDKETSK